MGQGKLILGQKIFDGIAFLTIVHSCVYQRRIAGIFIPNNVGVF
jgi:hypothetical protein